MLATPRGLITGGDATTKGGYNVGRIAFFDFNSIPAAQRHQHHDRRPDRGPGEASQRGSSPSPARPPPRAVSTGSSSRSSTADRTRYLADNLTTWQTANNTIITTLATPGATSTNWSLPLTITGNRWIELRARAFGNNGSQDPSPAIKKFETFDLSDQPPDANVSGPGGSIIASTTFTITGTATDDIGVQSIGLTLQDAANNRYLQDDGSVAATYNSFRVEPDVSVRTNTTWSFEVTVPYEGEWTVRARPDGHGGAVLPRHRRPHLAGRTATPSPRP